MFQLSEIIKNYKQLSIQIEQLTKQKEEMKIQLLELVNYQEGTYEDIEVSKVQPAPTFDWKAFLQEQRIEQRVASAYYKAKDAHIRVTIKRNITV